MTVLTIPTRPSQNAALRPVPWRRMAWVTWRQHRPTLISVPAVLGAVAVFLWIAGLKIHHDYAVLTACHPVSSDRLRGPEQRLQQHRLDDGEYHPHLHEPGAGRDRGVRGRPGAGPGA